MDPSLGKSAFHDIFFDLLDRDRRLIDPQNARSFAGRGANSAGKFREVVSRVQLANRLFPMPVVYQIVPVGDQVVDWAARLAEGHATVHAARALGPKTRFGEIEVDFEPVIDALRNRT